MPRPPPCGRLSGCPDDTGPLLFPGPPLNPKFERLLDRLLDRVARPSFVLRVAALAVCLLELSSAVLALMGYPTEPYDGALAGLYRRWGGDIHDTGFMLGCLGLLALFALMFWRLAREQHLDQPPRGVLARIVLLDAIALAVTPGLPFLVTVLAALLLRVRWAFGFALTQVALNLSLYWLLPSQAQRAEQLQSALPWWASSLTLATAMVALHGMAFGLGRLAANEAERRRWLQVILAEKLSGERLQVEQLRYAERMSMARELHDVMGHHLTALNLHLQLGGALMQRQDYDGAGQALEKARGGAAALLAEVRSAVSRERSAPAINLEAALHTLAQGIASTQIELELAPVARDLSPRCAHALLRCVQEAVTNSVRHAGATRVSITLTQQGDHEDARVRVRVEDNGRGARKLRPGNGLKGMQERMAELGGSAQVLRSWPGFQIELSCPRRA